MSSQPIAEEPNLLSFAFFGYTYKGSKGLRHHKLIVVQDLAKNVGRVIPWMFRDSRLYDFFAVHTDLKNSQQRRQLLRQLLVPLFTSIRTLPEKPRTSKSCPHALPGLSSIIVQGLDKY